MAKLLRFWDARSKDEPGNLFRVRMGPVLLDGVDVSKEAFRIEEWDDGTRSVTRYVKDGAEFIVLDSRLVTERIFGIVEFPD